MFFLHWPQDKEKDMIGYILVAFVNLSPPNNSQTKPILMVNFKVLTLFVMRLWKLKV